ncbi:hypothetical protein M413DRAFT_64626 [Hebeloma cylindrosporum]|uniref:Uncharacterized protein n=1 Tax=Hebeloma cylindrosporum TaxID=76867 RepID=A0A0C3CAS9_HEBCY|nr:hypothetical protein M413DRAFT_64626 [Hebeloma cylindrosporum h7]
MGVALPDLPQSTSDDNINRGEKDSIRRRALWALEGKPDVSFNKVEIPDISTPDIEKMMFDFSNKSSFQSSPASSYGNSLIGNKRDSFKLLGPSASAKDQLHTLVEEEEEDDDSVELPQADLHLPLTVSSITENVASPITSTPALAVTKATPAKHRPSNLNLRPLSLTPENLLSMAPSLPSPSPTPSPRTGLRSLSLAPSSSIEESSNDISTKQSRRRSLTLSPSPASRRPILNLALEQLENSPNSSASDERKPSRRSSISYKRSSAHGGVTMNLAGLPTPEMTPTFGRRYSATESLGSTGADDEFFPNPPTQTRPLSASEQHFLYKSHNALLARINDLERVLMRRRESGGYSNGASSRPLSLASNVSSTGSVAMGSAAGSEPSDEMLRLIADLKAERDELKRDVDGWRTRVGDMENQMSVLAKRVENERRDAWVARSRVGLLEVEKGVLMKKMEAVDELMEKEKGLWEQERQLLKEENVECKNRIGELVSELEGVKKELEVERLKKEEADSFATPTPRTFGAYSRPAAASKHGLGFMSVDSECSTTDIDSSDDSFRFGLKVVAEEENDDGDYSEEENALVGYEDEDEEDADTSLQSSSSFDSEEDLPRSLAHLQNMGLPQSPTTPKPLVFTPPRSGHVRKATLSKTWTFPFGGQQQIQAVEPEENDRFFGCLDDLGSDTTSSVPNSPSAYSYEKSKGIFSSGFKFAPPDDNASFFLPDGVGELADDDVEKDDETRLSIVAKAAEEEAESETEVEDEDMFGEIGGIRITFTPPQEEPEPKEERKQIQVSSPVKSTSPPPVLPALNFGEDEDDEEDEQDDLRKVIPFNFGRPLIDEREPSPPPSIAFPIIVTPPAALPRPASPSMIPRPTSPSSIPRAVSSRSMSSSSSDSFSSPPSKVSTMRPGASTTTFSSNYYITPPTKRGGALPSFIPQPVSSPSPLRSMPAPAKPRVIPTSTFIRQPVRKPLLPAVSAKSQNGVGSANGSTLIPTTVIRRSY